MLQKKRECFGSLRTFSYFQRMNILSETRNIAYLEDQYHQLHEEQLDRANHDLRFP